MYVRKDGPTPNGGAYSIAYFADEDRGSHGGAVQPVHIHEYSADGECVHWVSGYSMSAEPAGPAGRASSASTRPSCSWPRPASSGVPCRWTGFSRG